MKASKFILNTDYITPQNSAEGEATVIIPSSIYIPAGTIKIVSSSTITLGKSASENYRAYFTSTAFPQAITGTCGEAYLPYGGSTMFIGIERTKTTFKVVAYFPASPSNRNLSGTGQNITAHIQTFIDPFEV